jgi:hypothetical protein
MIGVVANPGEYVLVHEFFELFKTPWEFYRSEGQYEVLLCAREDAGVQRATAKLVVVYAGQETCLMRRKRSRSSLIEKREHCPTKVADSPFTATTSLF